MTHGFDAHRVFISAPGDLEPDREACYGVVAEVNERLAMPANILLVTVGLRDNEQISGSRAIISDNVRWSTWFIQVFEDDWGPRDLFRKLFFLASDCREDSTMPMRDIVVCLKDAPREADPQILAFRKELEELQNIRLLRYSDVDELKTKLTEVCSEWARTMIDTAAVAGS